MNQNIRKNRMRLLASFYEIASRFTEKELKEIRDDIGGDNVSKELSALMLRLNAIDELTEVSITKISKVPHSQGRGSVSTPKRREFALKEILSSRELFSTTLEIAKTIPIAVELRPKESRQKYVNRILAEFRSLSEQQQVAFTEVIQKRLEVKGAGNFVSRWSRLIREL